jgi:vitamin-K-epoxide reductase (warfarin-sensitive)
MTGFARKTMLAITGLATLGALDSAISLERHFSATRSSYCDLGANFSCDLVNRSTYSTIFGIPVAAAGILGYLALLALATLYQKKAETPAMLVIASLAGLGFSLYLTYVEAFILATWCILCLGSLILIFAIAMLSSGLLVHNRRQRKPHGMRHFERTS